MESSRSRIGYGLILSVLFGLLALGLLVWLVAISSDLGAEQEARIAAEAAEERERAARQQAETVLLSAETRAQNEANLREPRPGAARLLMMPQPPNSERNGNLSYAPQPSLNAGRPRQTPGPPNNEPNWRHRHSPPPRRNARRRRAT